MTPDASAARGAQWPAFVAVATAAIACGTPPEADEITSGPAPTILTDASPAAAGGPPIEGPCDVTLGEIAVYQAVKISLGSAGVPSPRLAAELVQGRGALLRAFVVPAPGRTPGPVEVQIVWRSPGGDVRRAERQTVHQASTDGNLGSTFNFQIPPAAVADDVRLQVLLTGPASCAATERFPRDGELQLAPRRTGVLKVRLVPVRYETDGSSRMPDLTDEQVRRYRERVMAIYPVTDVELSVREAVGTKVALGARGWTDLLESMRALRSNDRPSPDVYYYGLVAPTPTFASYCGASCVAGIAYRAPAGNPALRVGVGVGFTGETASQSLAHELGHQHGLAHAPCGASVGDVDRNYPQKDGSIGSWGYDLATGALFDPAVYRDFMGYCRASWISDYSYQALLARGLRVNDEQQTVRQALTVADLDGGRVALLDPASGSARWGQPWRETLAGLPREPAMVRDVAGAAVASVELHRLALGDGEEAAYVVPPPRPGWESVDIPGGAALRFSDAAAVPPLE